MSLITTHDDEDFQKLFAANSSKPRILYFTASWCGPCKQIAPLITQLANENSEKIAFFKVDIDDCAEIADEYKINSVPTFLLIINGEIVETVKGADEAGVKKLVEQCA